MNFYFCETCGKRLTEDQIREGAAYDKKLRGVFCKVCAVGVTTMDDLPLTQEEAKKLLEVASPQVTSPAPGPRRTRSRSSATGVPTGKRGLTPADRSSALKPSPKSATPLFAIIVGILVAVVVFVGLWGGGGTAPVEKSAALPVHQDHSTTHQSSALKKPSQEGQEIGSTAKGLRSRDLSKKFTTSQPLSAPEQENKATVDAPSTSLPASPPTPDGLEDPKAAAAGQTKAPDQVARKGEEAQPESHGPAPEKIVSKPPEATPKPDEAANLAKATFKKYLKTFDEALSKGDLVAACAAAERAQADSELKGVEKVANEVVSLVRLGQFLTAAVASKQRALEALKGGQKRTFWTAKCAVTGVVDKVEGDTLVISVTGQINKQVIEYKQRVNVSELTPACRDSVLGAKAPATPEEWLAEMFRSLAAKDIKQATQALINASAHPLAAHYQETLPELRLEKAVVAEGGTVTSYVQDGKSYKVHTFTADGTFSVTTGGAIEYLVVAGGGGGGGRLQGGGGGAGGLLAGTASVGVQSYAITVGAGGRGSNQNTGGQNLSSGGNSSIQGVVTAIGGGHGAEEGGAAGGGGSGGGACHYAKPDGGTETSGQGNKGGNCPNGCNGAGGGGAGGKGGNADGSGRAAGGAGVASSITGTSVIYATGGRGHPRPPHGQAGVTGSDALPNTGNGGDGGGGWGGSAGGGGNGGSGIVILRYRVLSGDSNLRFWISD